MWCYGEATTLLYDHKHIILSLLGVQQGDPLGPLYFCAGLMPLVDKISALNPVYNKWYMDDGGIVGDVELLQKVWTILKTDGPALGLFLNPSKCEWSWLDSSNTNPCPLRGEGSDKIALVPTDEIMMLGVPLGSKAFSAEYVQKKLFSRLRQSTSQLMEFEDTQSALYLLRISYGIVRANHFMRTTPLDHWQEQAVKFDSTIRDAAETILGYKFLPDSYVQACLTPKLGGIGIRRAIEHSPLAFSASWFESQKTAAEKWTPRPDMVPYLNSDGDPLTQKQASFVLDTRLHQELVARAP
jgi:hypothetical protein